jgi:lysophospholipase L1-like esterase
VTVFLGANDSSDDANDDTQGQGVDVEEYYENLREIVRRVKRDVGKEGRVIVVTPPDVDGDLWATRSTERVMQYADKVRMVSADEGVLLCDLWEGDGIDVKADLYDGLHLAKTGNAKVFDKIQNIVRSNMKEWAPDDKPDGNPNMTMCLPYWGALGSRKKE